MKRSILFVCLGNICRSPTAEAVFRSQIEEHPRLSGQISIDSAGTGDWHLGEPPDHRAQQVGRERGYDLSSLRARQISPADFERFDYILAMDQQNLNNLLKMKPENSVAEVRLFLDYAKTQAREVPDPYYTQGDRGFHQVIDLIESASLGLISTLEQDLA